MLIDIDQVGQVDFSWMYEGMCDDHCEAGQGTNRLRRSSSCATYQTSLNTSYLYFLHSLPSPFIRVLVDKSNARYMFPHPVK